MPLPSVKLVDCCTVVSGATPRTDVAEYWDGDIVWLTPKDIANLTNPVVVDSPDMITPAGFNSCSTQMLPAGAILVSSRAPIGHVAIAGHELCTNQGFKSLIPSAKVDTQYLYHCMKFHAKHLAELGNGATFKEVSKTIVEDFEIPLPTDVNEQRRIASILDKADTISKKRAAVVLDAGKYLRSAFFDLFGDPVANSKGLPEKPIAELAKVTTGNTPSREIAAYFGNHIEWIKSDNLNTPFHFLTKAAEGLSEAGLRVARSVPAGSTLITCIAGSPSCIGNAALADRNVSFNQQINALTPKPGIEPEFIYAATLFSKPRIQAASTNGMKGMVSKGALEQVRFILPPQDQREKFAGIFRKVMALTEKLEHSASEANALYGSLAQRAFQGKL